MDELFDERWKERALKGDPTAVAQLGEATLTPLYRFCFYRVARDHHLCEEVVQETLVRALRQLKDYDPKRSEDRIMPWLTGLARNEVRRVLGRERAGKLAQAWERLDAELLGVYAKLESQPLSDEHLQREETRELVNATMSQVPSQYREALEAKYVLGQSVRGIADALGLTEKSVESRLTRARSAFRATFLAMTRTLNVEGI